MTTKTVQEYLDSLPATQPERLKAHINNYYTVPEGTLADKLLSALLETQHQPLLDSIEDLIQADAKQDLPDG